MNTTSPHNTRRSRWSDPEEEAEEEAEEVEAEDYFSGDGSAVSAMRKFRSILKTSGC